mmetsp:Transcript_4211/g.9484  ORF Transcript_4211/g.9484 Transcript_4211/m.9484 type:complete len:494 (-) Transcript_4211:39-1520(-)
MKFLSAAILGFCTLSSQTGTSFAFNVPKSLQNRKSTQMAHNLLPHNQSYKRRHADDFFQVSMASSASTDSSPLSSWSELESHPSIQKPLQTPRPIYKDALPPEVEASNIDKPILYRDANCVCAASQMVWLGLECKNIDYLTVLVEKPFNLRSDESANRRIENANDEKNSMIPRIIWPETESNGDEMKNNDKNNQPTSDPIKLLEQIHSHYPAATPNFYPKLSAAVDASRCNILRFPGVMPRLSDPNFMSHAPLLFRPDGTLVPKSSHCVSLEELEEMLEEYYLGPYLCGKDVTAADVAWIPYLERYAVQLPMVYPNVDVLNPRSSDAYGEVWKWFLAMERDVPAYACAVMGDGRLWKRCLEEVVELHNERAATEEEKVTLGPEPKRKGWWMKNNPKGLELWKEYAEGRPWLGGTPEWEVALFLIRNREEIMKECGVDGADEALREVVQRLLYGDAGATLSEKACQIVQFVGERVSVPKDLGMVPALALWAISQ